ncbi:pentatricopeptide repeat-containing protein At4g22760 [Macadamia integrifolia]|uniref:pentatricopeptide repeat-containing protein At4g22760 n=1 Tax=Macadamia integrifolia TaxID=60698 RepID=UPI001C500D9C|nr:pentatricopeptide repeat-containing protein At4g22760 [Macadamia integrifolia]
MLEAKLTYLLTKCEKSNQAKQIHAQILTNGLTHLEPVLLQILLSGRNSSHIISQYVQQILKRLRDPDVFSWSFTIRYFTRHGRFKDAVALYAQMQSLGPSPTTFAVSSALKACARNADIKNGKAIHSQVHKCGFNGDVYVQTALVDLYSKLGDMMTAQKVFDEMADRNVVSWNSILSGYLKAGDLDMSQRVFKEIPKKDVVSWNSMISGYAKVGDMESANFLFQQMPERNAASWNAMISGYVDCGNIETARRLFDEIPCRSDVSWITMISGYSKSGYVDSAQELFDQMDQKDLLSWNAMISCYAQNSRPKEALQLFNKMQEPNVSVQPDKMTLASVISACSQLGDFRYGPWIEAFIKKIGIELDDHLVTALIDLYAKCGGIDKAHELFCGLRNRDLVAYSAMVLGYGINGKALDAIRIFEEMINAKIHPNLVTFTGILTAYNHAGLVEEGYRCFTSMIGEYGLLPSADHYGVMVDLLGRAGQLKEAYELIKSMPMQPHAGVWGALLLACKIHSNVDLGEIAAQHCFELEPDTSGYYSLLANLYASVGRWDDAKRLRKVMEEKGMTKIPGCSWMDST